MSDTSRTAATERLFLAVDLEPATRTALASRLSRLELPGRVVAAGHWHLTLVFLGATAADVRDRLCATLAARDLGPPFAVMLGPLGAFPRASRAGVLWIGVTDGTGPLVTLHGRVADAVHDVGLPKDDRPFTPHLTVSRVRPPADVRRLLSTTLLDMPPMTVEAVTLFRSVPDGGGTRYEIVRQFPLMR